MNKKLAWVIIFVLIVSALSFGRSFMGLIGVIPWHYGYSDVFNEDRINAGLAEKIPYLENPVEYPVVTGFFIYFMWLLGKNLLGYVLWTGIFLSLCSAITVIVLYKLCKLLNAGKQKFQEHGLIRIPTFTEKEPIFLYMWATISIIWKQ